MFYPVSMTNTRLIGESPRLAFDIGEPVREGGDQLLDSCQGVPLEQIAIPYEVSDREREEEWEIEGVAVRVRVRDTPPDDDSLLEDFLGLAELRRGRVNTDELVAETRAFLQNHGPLCLCVHGRGSGHDPHCDSILPGREIVGSVLVFADRCLAATNAAASLRSREPISELEESRLDLESVTLPLSLRMRVRPEDRPLLAERLNDPVVSGWLRLEELLTRLRDEAAGSLGCLPPLIRQVSAACHRDGRRRVCRNYECDNDFLPSSSKQVYCQKDDCNRSRSRQRQKRLPKCPACGRRVGQCNEECYYCGSALREG